MGSQICRHLPPLVLRAPTTHHGGPCRIDLATQVSTVAPFLRHRTAVALSNLFRRELLFEYALGQLGEVVDGPLIELSELLLLLRC